MASESLTGETIQKELQIIGVGVAEDIGNDRPTQEDRHVVVEDFSPVNTGEVCSLFAVFDGHGGSTGAEIASTSLVACLSTDLANMDTVDAALTNTFFTLDAQISNSGFLYGCTAAVLYIEGTQLHVANVGDSRVILINLNTGESYRLTKDHNLKDPEEIELAQGRGGAVAYGRVYNPNNPQSPGLNISRALGDSFFGDCISAEPFLNTVDLDQGDYRLVLECDGVWEGTRDTDLYNQTKELDAKESAQKLVTRSKEAGVRDNFTAIVVDLKVN